MSIPSNRPLAYTGLEEVNPRDTFYRRHAPTQNDFRGYSLGDRWVDSTSQKAYILVSKSNGIAIWDLIGAGGGSPVSTINGVNPIANNINLVNTGAINLAPGVGTLGVGVNVDGVTIQIIGNQLVAATASGVLTITGDVGAPVPPVAGDIQLKGSGGAITFSFNAPGQMTAAVQVDGVTMSVVGNQLVSTGILTTNFSVNGVWNINPKTKYVRVISWGGGGGGGGGNNQALGVDSFGASGGSAGCAINVMCPASVFPVASAIMIGMGGAGGLPGGNPGTNGTQTLVQTNVGNIIAPPGLGGDGGNNIPPNVTQSSVGVMDFTNLFYGEGGNGFTSGPFGTSDPADIFSVGFPNGGGGAGGVDSAEVEGPGANGGLISSAGITILLGGTGGIAPAGAGGAGNSITTQPYTGGGSGGGGGAGSATTDGGVGGNGGFPGGAGGGGGSCRNGNNGGAGGAGANGFVILIEYF